MDLNSKLVKLKSNLKELQSLALAFSGGVDSTFLLAVAHEVLGENTVAVTVSSPLMPKREIDEAKDYVKKIGARHEIIYLNPLKIEEVRKNLPSRCYICKKHIFTHIMKVAEKYQLLHVADGSNADDENDYRPGMKAIRELGVRSPLKEVGMTKEEIRVISKSMRLSTWDKPALACLATRFPYGSELTTEKLYQVDRAEKYLVELGFHQVRVRCHGDTARIEVEKNERKKFFNEEMMDKVYNKLNEIGFSYISLDLKGYRTGSLNHGLKGGV